MTFYAANPRKSHLFFFAFTWDGKVKASREVILSAGSIVSPQLLLLSGIGDKSELAQLGIPVIYHLPGVGDNLQDHVASYGLTWTTKGSGNAYNPFLYTIDPRTYLNWKLSRTGKSTPMKLACYHPIG